MGPWTLEKLALLQKYLTAFTIATQKARPRGKVTYVDLFAGPGMNRLRGSDKSFEGSPIIAMKLFPGFSRFLFAESDPGSWDSLQMWIAQLGRSRETDVVFGDCNQKITEVIDKIPRDGPCFVFLDPPSPALEWNTVSRIASLRVGYYQRRPEQFILFPYNMGLVRLMPFEETPQSIWGPTSEEQISRVMPDPTTWRKVYEAWRQGDYESQQKRRRFLYLYWMGLKELGYKHVLPPKLIKATNGHPLYDLFFASDHHAGRDIMGYLMNKPPDMFDQQLPLIQENPFDFRVGEQWYAELKSGGANAR